MILTFSLLIMVELAFSQVEIKEINHYGSGFQSINGISSGGSTKYEDSHPNIPTHLTLVGTYNASKWAKRLKSKTLLVLCDSIDEDVQFKFRNIMHDQWTFCDFMFIDKNNLEHYVESKNYWFLYFNHVSETVKDNPILNYYNTSAFRLDIYSKLKGDDYSLCKMHDLVMAYFIEEAFFTENIPESRIRLFNQKGGFYTYDAPKISAYATVIDFFPYFLHRMQTSLEYARSKEKLKTRSKDVLKSKIKKIRIHYFEKDGHERIQQQGLYVLESYSRNIMYKKIFQVFVEESGFDIQLISREGLEELIKIGSDDVIIWAEGLYITTLKGEGIGFIN